MESETLLQRKVTFAPCEPPAFKVVLFCGLSPLAQLHACCCFSGLVVMRMRTPKFVAKAHTQKILLFFLNLNSYKLSGVPDLGVGQRERAYASGST